MTLGYIIVFYFFDLYNLNIEFLNFNAFVNLLTVLVIAAVGASFLNYALFLHPIGRGIFVLANGTLFVLIFLWRIFFHQLAAFLFRPPRCLVIGAGPAGQEIAALLKSMPKSYEFVGFLDDHKPDEKADKQKREGSILAPASKLAEISEVRDIDLIIVAQQVPKNSSLGRLLLNTQLAGRRIQDLVRFYLDNRERIPISFVSETWLLNSKGFDWSEKSLSSRLKRMLDIIFSLLIFIITFPLGLMIALLIKITSKGPVFYTQKRVGQSEKIFLLYKFRSMISKAEGKEAVWASENDSRITPVGKVLRKLHLDELPQLINILKGEMSLVGPRPERPDFEKELKANIPYYALRHFVMPGLTGWAQVNYPYAASVQASKDKLEYDLYYVYNMTLLFDLRIILETLKNFFLRRQQGI